MRCALRAAHQRVSRSLALARCPPGSPRSAACCCSIPPRTRTSRCARNSWRAWRPAAENACPPRSTMSWTTSSAPICRRQRSRRLRRQGSSWRNSRSLSSAATCWWVGRPQVARWPLFLPPARALTNSPPAGRQRAGFAIQAAHACHAAAVAALEPQSARHCRHFVVRCAGWCFRPYVFPSDCGRGCVRAGVCSCVRARACVQPAKLARRCPPSPRPLCNTSSSPRCPRCKTLLHPRLRRYPHRRRPPPPLPPRRRRRHPRHPRPLPLRSLLQAARSRQCNRCRLPAHPTLQQQQQQQPPQHLQHPRHRLHPGWPPLRCVRRLLALAAGRLR